MLSGFELYPRCMGAPERIPKVWSGVNRFNKQRRRVFVFRDNNKNNA